MKEAEEVIRGYLGRAHRAFRREMPEIQRAFTDLYRAALKEGALPTKYKELVMLAEAVMTRCEPCIAVHMKKALEAGATREEIMEVLATCIVMGGGPCLGYCGFALKCYEEFTGKR